MKTPPRTDCPCCAGTPNAYGCPTCCADGFGWMTTAIDDAFAGFPTLRAELPVSSFEEPGSDGAVVLAFCDDRGDRYVQAALVDAAGDAFACRTFGIAPDADTFAWSVVVAKALVELSTDEGNFCPGDLPPLYTVDILSALRVGGLLR